MIDHDRQSIQLEISDETKEKWQKILDIIARILNVPASLIMRIVDSDISVFLSGKTENNPYKPGDKEHLKDSGLYCETVIKTNEMLHVPNALKDEHWKNNPDVKLNMISYLGFPIALPDNTPFGTICVLDNKENKYSEIHKQLILSFRETIEKDIELFYMNHALSVKNDHLKHNISKVNDLLAEKELLLKEVHHRIKNNMNTVAGIMTLQKETLKDPAAIAALDDAISRVNSMMILYDKIYRSNDVEKISFKEYISPLADEIVENFPNSKIVKIKKSIDDFMIDAKRLSALGIIFNEILTNIMKHAFAGRASGLITISAAVSDNRITISISDDGIGSPESFDISTSESFGFQLLDVMTRQLHGEIKALQDKGTKFVIEFNL
ncbi:MAG: putative sensor histidine kinase pdtaS [bacterium ADurb.Bin243]|nr:MAG: putative sensor histidine kinase pdtaS [bacterium ADurb.Bin243]